MTLRFKQLQILKRALIRLPLNLTSNRWFIIIGGRLFLSSSAAGKAWKNQFSGVTQSPVVGNPNVYVLITKLFSWRRKTPLSHQGLLIPHLGRFGNAVREVASAIQVGEQLGLGHLYLDGDNVFASDSDVPSPGIHTTENDLKIWIDRRLLRSEKEIELFVAWSRHHFSGINGKPVNPWDATRRALSLDYEVQSFAPDCLVIHLRGGDVFSERDVTNYGQPPLAYYLKVLDHKKWGSVRIVYQDDLNPVLPGIISACLDRGIPCEKSSGTLLQDLQVLLQAQVLVGGRGTFLPAVAGLSSHVSQVYFFEDKFRIEPPRHGIQVWRVIDAKGEYKQRILSGNWHNTVEQRNLMLSYLDKDLSIQLTT